MVEPGVQAAVRQTVIRFALVLLVCAAFAYLTYRLHGSPQQGIDDADISLAYASNLAHGHGFVYNIGGEHVEGFTSLLWVLICAGVVAFTKSPEPVLRVLCVLLVAATHTAVTLAVDRTYHPTGGIRPAFPTGLSILYLGLVCASPAYFTWQTITLMDSALWGVLLGLTASYLLTDPPTGNGRFQVWLSVLVVLLMLTRPESLALCPVIILAQWTRCVLRGASWREAARRLEGPIAAYVVTLVILTTFRQWYFGYPLPNTYYAKVSPSLFYNITRGMSYLGSYLVSTPVVACCGAVVIASLGYGLVSVLSPPFTLDAARNRALEFGLTGPRTVIGLLGTALLVMPVLTGGDHLPWWRFYQPAYPVIVLGLVCSIGDMRAWLPLRGTVLLLGVVLAFVVVRHDVSWVGTRSSQPVRVQFDNSEEGRRNGRIYAGVFRNAGVVPSLGVIGAGGIRRTYHGEIVDLMGLNSVAMGHSDGERRGLKNHAAFNERQFFVLLPDIVEPGTTTQSAAEVTKQIAAWDDISGANVVLHRIPADPQFRALYQCAGIRQSRTHDSVWVVGYFRRSLLMKLEKSGLYEVLVRGQVQ